MKFENRKILYAYLKTSPKEILPLFSRVDVSQFPAARPIHDRLLWVDNGTSVPLDSYEERVLAMVDISADKDKTLLQHQLKIVTAIMRLSRVPALRSVEEVKKLFIGHTQGITGEVVHSAVEYMRNEDRPEIVTAIFDQLEKNNKHHRFFYNWDAAVVFVLSLHAAYYRFSFLSEEKQLFLLRHYFYRAIATGVPVREKLSEALYETRTVIAYAARCKQYLDVLEANDEEIPMGDTVSVWKNLVQKYLQEVQGDFTLEEKQRKFVHTIYTDAGSEQYQAWLFDAIAVYSHIKNADLIDHNRGSEMAEIDLYHNDLVMLVAFSAIGMAGEEKIATYYAKEHPRVPLKALLRELKEHTVLQGEAVIQNFLELTTIFRKHGLIKNDEDLIVFHEADGAFHWNEDIFSP